MARRSKTLREEAETRYPWRVDIPVPSDGLGKKLNDMETWCRAELLDEPWERHGRSVPEDAQGIKTQVSRFYFKDGAAAQVFQAQWGGETSRK